VSRLKWVPEIEEPVEVRYRPNRIFHAENMPFTKKAQQYFWEIRIFVIQLLKYQQFPEASQSQHS
jgi:hypothetical protein